MATCLCPDCGKRLSQLDCREIQHHFWDVKRSGDKEWNRFFVDEYDYACPECRMIVDPEAIGFFGHDCKSGKTLCPNCGRCEECYEDLYEEDGLCSEPYVEPSDSMHVKSDSVNDLVDFLEDYPANGSAEVELEAVIEYANDCPDEELKAWLLKQVANADNDFLRFKYG